MESKGGLFKQHAQLVREPGKCQSTALTAMFPVHAPAANANPKESTLNLHMQTAQDNLNADTEGAWLLSAVS